MNVGSLFKKQISIFRTLQCQFDFIYTTEQLSKMLITQRFLHR